MIYIIGVGSHAEVVASLLEDDYEFISWGDHDQFRILQDMNKNSRYKFIIGIGDNYLRKQIVEYIEENFINYEFVNVIAKNAYIADNVQIGIGNVICPGVIIQNNASIGNHNILNTKSSIDHHCELRSFIHIAPNVTLCGKVKLFEGVFIGVNSSVTPNISIRPWSFYKAQSLIKESTIPIPIYDVFISSKEYVHEALDSGWISSQGKFVKQASSELERVFKSNVLMVANGTCATHCIFMALKEFHPEIKKIYVPDNVYVAVWNCLLMEYPSEMMEVLQMDEKTLNMNTDENYIFSLEKNSAVVVVHNLGNVVNVARLKRLRPDLIFIEDACEAFGGSYEGLPVGSESLCSSMSFFANKTITAGELGAVMTPRKDVYDFLAKKINQGNSEKRYIHTMLGYNYRASNIHCALLCDQLRNYKEIEQKKEHIFTLYEKEFPRISEPDTKAAKWIMNVYFPNNPSFEHAEEYFKNLGIDIRPMFYPINTHEHLKHIKTLPNNIHQYNIMIPSYPKLTEREALYIIDNVKRYKKMIS